MVNVYLVVAYAFVWAIFTFYAWIIHRRQRKLEIEVEELRHDLGAKSPAASTSIDTGCLCN